MPLPRVKLVLMSDQQNLIEVDGKDITAAIAAIQVGRVAGEPLTHVTLHLNAEVELDTDVAEVVVNRDQGGLALQEFVGQIDPGELEQAALARMGGLDDGPSTVGEAMVDVLKEWAQD